ncbi:uroporphyrinogen-III C-methyltransferase [Microlunatus endophyticus]|uniref:uroporphyrinogen-III C-methyltransferase n=1 Tax=Microlunatus endophyticus TaxID=1716077 RepID=A0A917W5T2_9ACTN|nr:uroporphyrinogen-III C-methyltransferase [Microlunatus endophyticus]
MVVIGASNPSPAEVAALLQADARVQVYATEPGPAVQDLADRVRLQLSRLSPTAFTADGALLARILDGVALVITDGGTEADRAVLAAAEKVGVVAVRLTPGGQESGGQESGGHEPGQDGPDRVGRVVLVGGGPGDPGLLTIAGMEAIRSADVIATDRLAPLAALANARVDAEIIDVGKIPRGPGVGQQTIEELLVDRARRGKTVVRFKGGDSFVFGRGGEEWQTCAAAGIPVTVIPGVTSASAAPAAAGIPLTHRQLSQGFTVVTGHVPPGDPRSKIDWPSLATSGLTLVIMMGMANLQSIAETLINHGLAAQTPAAVVADGTLATMRSVRAPLAEIAAQAAKAGLGAPATVVIGAVAGFTLS